MSLPAMTSGDRFCFSKKGGIGGGGWVHLIGADSMAVCGLCFENTLVGSEWATAVLLCTNGFRKQSSCPACAHFRGSIYPSLGERLPAECRDYCQFVNGWMWFESQMCRGWL